ncbi:MAG: NRAMP family metal ion transporter [Gammaproteobacteria bacterium RIFCSPHIGHO2_02_FULL_42_13]|nr:MAG: NRAMP family metal ion transporter [Gammaproteobacteria bacterium RIFCSPHIGHO2_02_FULL_42_13]OGT70902.1 MAG: NRAMP family metal ion transporter [Gammaproteobacteria bacterium RIFCSPLOWO2_02_FULL_42_9]
MAHIIKQRSFYRRLKLFLAVFGPGIVVMLADTDAGSVITAAQTGAIWQYRMINLQLLLIPILYIAQELTVRLGLVTRLGHGELIKKHFGKFWAWFSITTLLVCCVGAIISQFVGLVGVGMLFNIPGWIIVLLTTIFLTTIIVTGTYHSVERCAMAIGLFELVFLAVAYMSHPSWSAIIKGLTSTPLLTNPSYLYLAAANIGAVVMPWMIFYQQSAVVDKKLKTDALTLARWDTAIGAVVTQFIMIAIIITTASTIGKTHPGESLNTVHQISEALTPFLGKTAGEILFALGMIGASLIAAIVVSLTAAWALGEVTGYKHSLEHHPREAPWFYIIYFLTLSAGGMLVLSGINLVNLSVAVEVLNAILLPIVLGFLFLLALNALPKPFKLNKYYAIFVGVILSVTSLFGLIAGVWGGVQLFY